ncbi:MAG: hypothetical protein EZS28_025126 [Streblomastix strix]|uniref:Uncharacterized protein n=1 Tax=Streblomastix strix TaxID=222440 RepID=A0A5J4VA55_9EUKA|nr:MAG: hypothetical protein EZS28_025126 [Streblomastix strix]
MEDQPALIEKNAQLLTTPDSQHFSAIEQEHETHIPENNDIISTSQLDNDDKDTIIQRLQQQLSAAEEMRRRAVEEKRKVEAQRKILEQLLSTGQQDIQQSNNESKSDDDRRLRHQDITLVRQTHPKISAASASAAQAQQQTLYTSQQYALQFGNSAITDSNKNGQVTGPLNKLISDKRVVDLMAENQRLLDEKQKLKKQLSQTEERLKTAEDKLLYIEHMSERRQQRNNRDDDVSQTGSLSYSISGSNYDSDKLSERSRSGSRIRSD